MTDAGAPSESRHACSGRAPQVAPAGDTLASAGATLIRLYFSASRAAGATTLHRTGEAAVTQHPGACLLALAAAAPLFIASPAAAQPAFPAKPIRFIVPYAAGSSLDVQARLYAPKLAEGLGQPVFVDNRGGGNTVIGSEALLRSPPDGHTIMIVAATHVIVPSLLTKVPYDPIRDFAPVANLTRNELVLVVHPSLPARSLREFIALAKSKPGQLNFGSPGTGTATHLSIELFNLTAGIRMQHVPYNGAGPLTIDLLGGHIASSLQAPITVIPHVNSGRTRALAITGSSRLPPLPQVPTFAEAGCPASRSRSGSAFSRPRARRNPSSTGSTPNSASSCNYPNSGKSWPRKASTRSCSIPSSSLR